MPTLLKLLYTVNEAKDVIAGSRSTVYALVEAGHLRAVKRGRTTLITAESLEQYAAGLEEQS